MDELLAHWPDAGQRIALRRRAGPVPGRRRVRRQAFRRRERNRDGPDVSRNADATDSRLRVPVEAKRTSVPQCALRRHALLPRLDVFDDKTIVHATT